MTIPIINKTILSMTLILTITLDVEASTDGCSSTVSTESKGCDVKSLLVKEEKELFKIEEAHPIPQNNNQTNISKELKSINVNHKGKELTIVRTLQDNKIGCPPNCIVPMGIDGVKTIGELETLDFIKKLNNKHSSLILDTRESVYYNRGTIPGALNLPSHMLEEDSKYFNDVIAILGIKKINDKWQFKEIHELLIFDDGITDNKASKAIKSLLKLSYPSDKILYYRGGVKSWKNLGLTVY